MAIPPSRMAPPIPTTTPMTMRFCEGSNPDLVESVSVSSLVVGFEVEVTKEVETGTTVLPVDTLVRVLLPLTVTTVVTNCCVWLLTDLDTV